MIASGKGKKKKRKNNTRLFRRSRMLFSISPSRDQRREAPKIENKDSKTHRFALLGRGRGAGRGRRGIRPVHRARVRAENCARCGQIFREVRVTDASLHPHETTRGNEKATAESSPRRLIRVYGHVVSGRSSGEISFRGSWPFRYGGVTHPASYDTLQ